MTNQKKTKFGDYITQSLKKAKIRKIDLVAELGIHSSTLSRNFSGNISKTNALAIISTANKLAKGPLVDESKALKLLGFEAIDENQTAVELSEGIILNIDSEKFDDEKISKLIEDLKLTLEISLRRINEK